MRPSLRMLVVHRPGAFFYAASLELACRYNIPGAGMNTSLVIDLFDWRCTVLALLTLGLCVGS